MNQVYVCVCIYIYIPSLLDLPPNPTPLWKVYAKKTMIQKDICALMLFAVLFTITRTWKQPKCLSTDEQIKMWTSSFKRKIVLMVESVHNMVPEVSPYLRI